MRPGIVCLFLMLSASIALTSCGEVSRRAGLEISYGANALQKLQRTRGFVPQKTAAELAAFEYMGYFPEDMEKYVESLSRFGNNLPHNDEL